MATEDGWEPSPRIEPDSNLLVWKGVPGCDVTIQVRNDDAGRLMLAYAADYNAYVEPLRDAETACYTPTNIVDTSNHLNATAMDFNWNSYPWKVRGNLTDAKLANLRALLAFYQPWMFWAGDWDDAYVDEMHHQMNYGSYDLAQHGDLARWLAANVRDDGFSTWRRGGVIPPAPDTPVVAPQPLPVHDDDTAAKVLYDAVPEFDEAEAARLADTIITGLADSECDNSKRIAMWLAQIGEESGGFVYTEEIAKDGRYAPYIGRTWIQITWKQNYADFGQWCVDKGLLTDPDTFVNDPTYLANALWEAIGPAWYWTVQRPQINGLCDQGDILGVTKAINGGTNGLQDRTDRYNQAIALGDRLLLLIKTEAPPVAPTTGDPFKDWYKGATDRELLEYLVAQLGPGDPAWSAKGSTLRDELWSLASGTAKTAAKAAVTAAKKATKK